MTVISPSLVALDFARLGEELEAIQRAGVKLVHIDVCDGHFAPGITVGLPVVASLRKACGLDLDVHLRVERPERFVLDFIEAGANRLEVHPESTTDLDYVLRIIRSKGIQAGVALNPSTPVEVASELVEELDFINILYREPGMADQPFSGRILGKVEETVRLRLEERARFAVQVEGEGGGQELRKLAAAGADVIVVSRQIRHPGSLETNLRGLLAQVSETRENSVASAGSH